MHRSAWPNLLSLTLTLFIYVGYADVEFSAMFACHHPHIGDEERPEVALLAAEVPHPVTLLYLSLGSSLSSLSAMMAPRSRGLDTSWMHRTRATA